MNNKEKYLCSAVLILIIVSTVMSIIARTNHCNLLLTWRLLLISTDTCWWPIAKEHFKKVEDDLFSFRTEVLQKEVFETVPLALAGGIIGIIVF